MATPWQQHVAKWKDCTKCPLAVQRSRIVLARGSVPCDVLFVGEAPGESENVIGQPFVGPAGKVLDQIVEQSIPSTLRVAFTNLVACFPRDAKRRGDNEPEESEILECRPRLHEFFNVAKPKLIVCVGKLAAEYVDHDAGIRCVDIVHPAAILRMPVVQREMAARKAEVTIANAVEVL